MPGKSTQRRGDSCKATADRGAAAHGPEAATAYEAVLGVSRGRRRAIGAFYTPAGVVDGLLDLALGPLLRRASSESAALRLRILDPACGTGNFLLPAAARLACRIAELRGRQRGAMRDVLGACIAGWDVDEAAVAICRERLRAVCAKWGDEEPALNVRCADALAEKPGPERFDLVIGNPPFLNQLGGDTAAAPPEAARLRERFGDLRRAYTDASACFLLAGLELVRAGGVVCMIQPLSLLAARDAAPVRRRVLERCAMTSLWVAGERVFDAGVHVCAPVLVEGTGQGQVSRRVGPGFADAPVAPLGGSALLAEETWGGLVADLMGIPCPRLCAAGQVGDLASATADFRDEYYALRGVLVEGGEGGPGLPPVVTSGLIDLAELKWGRFTARIHRRAWRAPRAELSRMEPASAGRAALRLVPKLLLATQTGVLEVVADARGELLPVTPVISIMPRRPEDLWRLGAALASPPLAALAAARYAGAALSPGAIKLSASQVLRLPLPGGDPGAWETAGEFFRHACGDAAGRENHLEAAAAAMCAAYGVGREEAEALLKWWWGRRRRSARPGGREAVRAAREG